MSGIVDPAIVELATESRYRVSVVAGTTVMQGVETEFIARADGVGEFVLEDSDRGSAPHVEVRSNSWEAVQLTLCMTLGPVWRSVHKLPRLDDVECGRAVIDVDLVDVEDENADVRWGDGQYALGLLDVDAITLSHLLGRPIQEVVDSYRDPDGLPVFA